MGLGPEGAQGRQRLALHRQLHGWLTFPLAWWPAGEVTDTDVLSARQQTVLVIPGGG